MSISDQKRQPREQDVCPLCASTVTTEIDHFAAASLAFEYRRQWNIDVTAEFGDRLISFRLLRCDNCGLERFEPLLAGSESFYRKLSAHASYYEPQRWEFERVATMISRHDSVLDIGCGDGAFLKLLECASKKGIDLNRDAVAKAKELGLDVEHSSLEKFPNSEFDVVTIFQVLEHVPQPLILLNQMANLLKPDGRLIVSVPNNDGFMGAVAYEPLNSPPHHPLRWTRRALQHVANLFPLRLELLEPEPLNSVHYFACRRTAWLRRLHRLLGSAPGRMTQTPKALVLRKLATILTLLSGRLLMNLDVSSQPGHSYLAVYRRSEKQSIDA